jgi:hypothetical protein
MEKSTPKQLHWCHSNSRPEATIIISEWRYLRTLADEIIE